MRRRLAALALSLLPGCVVTGNGIAKQQDRALDPFDTIELTDVVDVVVREGAPKDGVEVICDENAIDLLETRVSGGILSVGFGGASVSTSTTCAVATGNMDLVELISIGVGDLSVTGPAWSLSSIRSDAVGEISVDLRAGLAPDDERDLLLEGTESAESERLFFQAPELFIDAESLGDISVSGLDRDRVEVRQAGVGDIQLRGEAVELLAESSDLGDVHTRDLTVLEAQLYGASAGDITATVLEDVLVENTGIGDVTVYGNPKTREVVNDSVGDVRFR